MNMVSPPAGAGSLRVTVIATSVLPEFPSATDGVVVDHVMVLPDWACSVLYGK